MPKSKLKTHGSIAVILFIILRTPFAGLAQQTIDFDTMFASRAYFDQVTTLGNNEIFRLIQYRCPWRYGYSQTLLDENGGARTERVTTYAVEATRTAKLSRRDIDKIKILMKNLMERGTVVRKEPDPEQVCNSLVFRNKHGSSRLDFVGEEPPELREVVALLSVNFDRAEREWIDAFNKRNEQIRAKYGDWRNQSGLVRASDSGEVSLKNGPFGPYRLLRLRGHRQPVEDNTQDIPIIYALVAFPATGLVIGGASRKGPVSDSPISGIGLTWTTRRTGYKPDHQLLIEYNMMDFTISVGGSKYDPNDGNLLIIEMDKSWRPKVRQLPVRLDALANNQTILDFFNHSLPKQKMAILDAH